MLTITIFTMTLSALFGAVIFAINEEEISGLQQEPAKARTQNGR